MDQKIKMAIAVPKKKKYTYEDYAKLPEGAPYQLIGGELIMTPAPTPYHQRISRKIEFLLILYFDTFLLTSKSEPRRNGQNWRKSANPKQHVVPRNVKKYLTKRFWCDI